MVEALRNHGRNILKRKADKQQDRRETLQHRIVWRKRKNLGIKKIEMLQD